MDDEMQQQSQLDPLPEVPFRIISKTIGRGAYASIKKAVPLEDQSPVFAVKFVHKGYAIKHGRISAKQIAMEVSLHHHIGQHPHVIEWFATGENDVWRWIAMEYAEGGDLFDKIEPDTGVHENIAHVYFRQLVSGVSFIHSKGVAHRDLKPENILLSDDGNLKLADFGMATMFEYKGAKKQSATMCGSPPYIAPEVLTCAAMDKKDPKAMKYSAELVDMWSCGVILFVLLVGNTPWEEPSNRSWEFKEYVRNKGHSPDDLWQRVPPEALSLLRGMMSIEPGKRFSFAQIRQHPWYTRYNELLEPDGKVQDPLELATQMLSNLRVDLNEEPPPSQRSDAMDIDDPASQGWRSKFSNTQPETPINDAEFDWERPTMGVSKPVVASQPTLGSRGVDMAFETRPSYAFDMLAGEPTMSQFSQSPGIPISLTQQARQFRDIVPNYSLARFYSHIPPKLLVSMLSDALHQLNVPLQPPATNFHSDHITTIKVKTFDGRHQSLHGEIVVEKYHLADNQELLEVRFVKIKGDPLEWRRFFKKTALLCKAGIYRQDE